MRANSIKIRVKFLSKVQEKEIKRTDSTTLLLILVNNTEKILLNQNISFVTKIWVHVDGLKLDQKVSPFVSTYPCSLEKNPVPSSAFQNIFKCS